MIPRTFPSTYASNGQQQMVVYFLPSIAGLQRWLDYIPVKLAQGGVENSYNNNGYIDVTVVSRPTAAQQAWKEYIPAYLDDAATDAWRVNATGYIPYGYALFGGASMIMDMTNTGALDPRITFSRTSNATQFDSAGALVYAPHNLLLFSEQFDNAAWVKQASVSAAANTTVAPNGTTTADTVTADSGVGAYQNVTTTVGTTITQSVYIKAGTATAVMFRDDTGSGRHIVVNTSTGAITSTSGTLIASGSQPAANGFFRIFFTYVADTTLVRGIIRPDSAGSAQTFIVWGAQTNAGTLQPYYPTTVKNALGYSQEFDNAAWTKARSSISATKVTAPDGSVTGQKLVEDTSASTTHFARQDVTVIAGTRYTKSIQFKAAERSQLQINFDTDGGVFDGTAVLFTASGSGISSVISGTPIGFGITALGNGWYRCWVTQAALLSGTFVNRHYLAAGGTPVYTGDGTSGIFIWGAQLSDSASLDPYVYNPVAAPTAAAYYGPRFDYDPATLAARGLLIEEQRTNLLLNSDTLATQNVTVAAVAHTLSFYGTGTVTLSGVSTAGPLVGAGVFPSRVTLTFTPTAGTLTLTVTGSVRFAQLEAGSFATSYIPTTTAAATRTADNASMIGANFSNWYNQSEGTLFADLSNFTRIAATFPRLVALVGTDANNDEISIYSRGSGAGAGEAIGSITAAGTNTFDSGLVSPTVDTWKAAIAYRANNAAFGTSGQVSATDTTVTLPVAVAMRICGAVRFQPMPSAWVRRIAYFPTRLTNAQLQAVTA